jgi:hypothetical protein
MKIFKFFKLRFGIGWGDPVHECDEYCFEDGCEDYLYIPSEPPAEGTMERTIYEITQESMRESMRELASKAPYFNAKITNIEVNPKGFTIPFLADKGHTPEREME